MGRDGSRLLGEGICNAFQVVRSVNRWPRFLIVFFTDRRRESGIR
jgi:hypothetical protein